MSARPTVMLCTSNGTGLGHLARVMAVAEHLRERADVVIFTLSAALSVPVDQGFRVEYLRSREHSGLTGAAWNSLLSQRLEHLLSIYRPSSLVFDGTHPYLGLCRVLDRHDEVTAIWQRRGMWQEGKGSEALARAHHFDIVVEPGDYAADADHGPTTKQREGVRRVAPIRFGPQPMPRENARDELGLDPEQLVGLVQLGAGQINEVDSMVSSVCDAILSSGRAGVVLATSVISKPIEPRDERVHVLRTFPVTAYMDAFDFGFFAAGYNSFHEALSLGLPSVFVPNRQTKLDDQAARSRYAAEHGLALEWDGESPTMLRDCVARLVDERVRTEFRTRMSTLASADGARGVAELVLDALGPSRV